MNEFLRWRQKTVLFSHSSIQKVEMYAKTQLNRCQVNERSYELGE